MINKFFDNKLLVISATAVLLFAWLVASRPMKPLFAQGVPDPVTLNPRDEFTIPVDTEERIRDVSTNGLGLYILATNPSTTTKYAEILEVDQHGLIQSRFRLLDASTSPLEVQADVHGSVAVLQRDQLSLSDQAKRFPAGIAEPQRNRVHRK